MKKTFPILFLILTVSNLKAESRFGIVAGVNMSKIDIAIPDWRDYLLYHLGYGIGLDSKLKLSENFDFSCSLIYNQKGTDIDNSRYNLPKTKWSLNYISLTPEIIFKPHKAFGIEIGPQFSYLLMANQRYSYTLSSNQNVITENANITSTFRKIDVSIVAGLVFMIKDNLSFAVKYNHGFLDINNNVDYISPNNFNDPLIPTEYNRSYCLEVTYYFKKSLP